MKFTNVTMTNNEFDYIDGGAITVNPMTIWLEGMPVFNDCKFIGNRNINEINGFGVISWYVNINYALYPLTLSVNN